MDDLYGYLNSDKSITNLHWGQVVLNSKDDPSGAGRCKVFINKFDRRLPDGGLKKSDTKKNPENAAELINRLPWSSPIVSRNIITTPKVGETVLVLITEPTNHSLDGSRWFFGPIIQQNQNLSNDGVLIGIESGKRGAFNGIEKLKKPWFDKVGSRIGGRKSVTNWSTYGDHPNDPENITINGRGNQDIILRSDENYDEVLIRIGKYKEKNKRLNEKNPGYISMAYYNDNNNKNIKNKSIINVVGDQINLISHKGSKPTGRGDGIILNTSEPTKQTNFENINLKPIVYGDKFWEFVTLVESFVRGHIHTGPKLPANESGPTSGLLDWIATNKGSRSIQTSENGIPYFKYESRLISNNVKIN